MKQTDKRISKPSAKPRDTKKKKYDKPKINHSSEIQTLAGSCSGTSGCTPNVT